MITVIEPTCKGWEHEEVNAGLLQLIDDCLEYREKIVFVSEKKQIEAVSALYKSESLFFDELNIDSRFDREMEVNKCVRLISKLILRKKTRKVFVSAAYFPCIKAIRKIAKCYRNIYFYIVLHGMIEKKFGNQHIYDELIINEIENVTYITYSKMCHDRYRMMGANNIIFLHHPFIEAKKDRSLNLTEKIHIGIIGACANSNAKRLINKVRKNEQLNNVEFNIMSSNVKEFREYKGCTLCSNFSRQKMEEFMAGLDFVLLPYGKSDYTLSASGVLWDAISNKIPCICYDSEYIKYYQKKIGIGFVGNSLDEMYEYIKNKSTSFYTDALDLKKIGCLIDENKKIMREVLKK